MRGLHDAGELGLQRIAVRHDDEVRASKRPGRFALPSMGKQSIIKPAPRVDQHDIEVTSNATMLECVVKDGTVGAAAHERFDPGPPIGVNHDGDVAEQAAMLARFVTDITLGASVPTQHDSGAAPRIAQLPDHPPHDR